MGMQDSGEAGEYTHHLSGLARGYENKDTYTDSCILKTTEKTHMAMLYHKMPKR